MGDSVKNGINGIGLDGDWIYVQYELERYRNFYRYVIFGGRT